mmetsp:Transcript_47398/g.101395  ORF Transcript_47398/g.101395 Transcript_47398/m.101395 type:complete len:385 (+) Transcript_47398:199-1353(+)
MLSSPYFSPRRSISCTRVVINLAPVPPRGWPSAMAPPFTFSRSIFRPTAFTQANGTGAKASFTSYNPTSSIFSPNFSSTFWEAGTGPSSMITGSVPTSSSPTSLAMGFTPSFSRPRSLQISTAAAPSQIWEDTAGVITPLGCRAFSLARVSMVVARIPSSTSWVPEDSPLLRFTGTGTISFLNLPSLVAFAARSWDRTANCSSSSRVMLYFLASSSAPPNWENRAGLISNCAKSFFICSPYFSRMVSVIGTPAPAFTPARMLEPIGTRDIISTPPAMTTSCTPDITAWAAKWMDCWEDPHWRSTLHPGTDSGIFLAASTTFLPMFPACAPIWETQPKMTSSICFPSMPVLSTKASQTSAPRSAGCHPDSAPLRLPPAVRAASTT